MRHSDSEYQIYGAYLGGGGSSNSFGIQVLGASVYEIVHKNVIKIALLSRIDYFEIFMGIAMNLK